MEQMLAFREEKVMMQQELRHLFPGSVVVSLGLNIPGPRKNSDLIQDAFYAGVEAMDSLLKQQGIHMLKKKLITKPEGNLVLYALESEDGVAIKYDTVTLEETHPLGRLFDIDIYTPEGDCISREQIGLPGRKCFLCGNDAKACGRSRAHPINQLEQKVQEILIYWKEQEMQLRHR